MPSGLTTRASSEGLEFDGLKAPDDLPRRLLVGPEVEAIGIGHGARVVKESDPGRIELGELTAGSNQVMLLNTKHEIGFITLAQGSRSVMREVKTEVCCHLLHRVRSCITWDCMRACA